MKILKLISLFIIVNFGSLAFGSWLMGEGASSQWYRSLNKAYWEPEGWVFGVAWTIIIICFSIYLGFLSNELIKKNNLRINQIFSFKFNFPTLFLIHLFLNISWNYIFFNQHMTVLALTDIILLTILLFYFLFKFLPILKFKSILILPYCIWLIIATSLNLYIVIYN